MQPVTPCSSVGQLGRPSVFVIVLNWNGWRDTLECLESVYRLDYPNYRVLVVDNGSEDGSLDHMCSWAEGREEVWLDTIPGSLQHHVTPPIPKPISWKILHTDELSNSADRIGAAALGEKALTILETGSNLGYAGGNNAGIRHAIASGAEYMWILNNDTVVDRHALSALVDRMDRGVDVGLCGATLMRYYEPELVHVTGGAGFDQTKGQQKLLGYGERIGTLPDSASVEASLAYVAGSATLVSRRFIGDVGLMDEHYFLYYEELDWAIRGASKGYSLGYAPNAIMYHKEGGSIGSSGRNPIPSPLAEYYLTRNLLLIVRKYYPKSTTRVWSQLILRLAKRILTWKWANARALVLALVRPALGSHLGAVRNVLESNRVSAGSSAVHLDRPRILYLMHVDWDSIWQRPHELARQLAKEYNVRVAFAYGRHRGTMRSNDRSGLIAWPFLQLPLRRQLALSAAVNSALLRPAFAAMVRSSRADIIWLTYPEQVEYIPGEYKGKVIYDCMDDVLAFPQPAAFTERMRHDECALIRRADLVLTSSMSLGKTLCSRYGTSVHTRLVRNGCDNNGSVGATNAASRGADGLWHLGYVGTLANVDAEAIIKLVQSVPDVCVDLVGPAAGWKGPTNHPRLHLLGTLQHERLAGFAFTCCCLIAPFPHTTLTEGVDPVKLYEYVSWGRPIVVLRYPEVERFGAFVEFYETPQELVEVVSRMCSEGFVRKYSEEQRTEFLKENTWEVRGRQVRQELRDLLSGVDG